MTEESLPLIDPKPQHDAVQSFCAANARKLALLLVLFLSGSLGLGAKFWLDRKEMSVSLDQLLGSHEVLTTLLALLICSSAFTHTKQPVALLV